MSGEFSDNGVDSQNKRHDQQPCLEPDPGRISSTSYYYFWRILWYTGTNGVKPKLMESPLARISGEFGEVHHPVVERNPEDDATTKHPAVWKGDDEE